MPVPSSPAASAPPESAAPATKRSKPGTFRRPPSIAGVWLACLAYLVSLTPSLVPRTTAVQVLTSVLLSLTGYALGAAVGAVLRRLRSAAGAESPGWPGGRSGMRRLLVLVPIAASLAFTRFGVAWQEARSELVGWPPPSWTTVAVLTPSIVVLLVVLGRAVRALAGRLRLWLQGRLGQGPAGRLAAPLAVVGTALLVVFTLLIPLTWIYSRFLDLDRSTLGQTAPTSAFRSGSPSSLSAWDLLGRQGRYFVSEGPSVADIAGFTGNAAQEPIRAYAGLAQASTAEERAELLMAELERTGGFDREYLVLVVTSGLGSVHPTAASTLEYVADGDVATGATQFSSVPSWMTQVLNGDGAERETQALLEALEPRLGSRSPQARPHVVLYAESLGAYGSQQYLAGSSPQQVADRFDGVLWAGTPAASDLMRDWVGASAAPAWEPQVADGTIARFAATPERIAIDDPTWGPSRILFLQTPSDPVAFLSSSVARLRPDWLAEGATADALEGMVWWPVLTWEQLLVDLTTNGIVPPGFGHNYSHAHAAAWAAVLQEAGWSGERADELNEYRRGVGPPDPGLAIPDPG